MNGRYIINSTLVSHASVFVYALKHKYRYQINYNRCLNGGEKCLFISVRSVCKVHEEDAKSRKLLYKSITLLVLGEKVKIQEREKRDFGGNIESSPETRLRVSNLCWWEGRNICNFTFVILTLTPPNPAGASFISYNHDWTVS